jgi:sugar-specific transcriptional regulator TrmB
MEGVSAAASVIQVVDVAARVYMALYAYFRSVKDAPRRSRELRDEVRLVSDVLELLKSNLATCPPDRSDALPVIKSMNNAISRLTETLNEIEKKIEVSKTDVIKRMKWPFSEKENEKYLDTLQRYNTTFNTFLNALGLYFHPRLV